ncbi:MAG TPA: cellulose synthase operon protein YhjQ/BcsQ [Terracidiphilus sp.]
MEQAIAAEWGRFLRDVDAKRTETLKTNGGAKPENGGRAQNEKASQSAWQRLEDALALPPEPDRLLAGEALAARGTAAEEPVLQEGARVDDAFLAKLSKTTVPGGDAAAWMNAQPAAANAMAEAQRSATPEQGTYAIRSQWVGTGFEDRRVLVPPPEPLVAPEAQPEAGRDEASAKAASWMPSDDAGGMAAQSIAPADLSVATAAPHNGGLQQESSRWFVLKGMTGGASKQQESPEATPTTNVPVLEVFSLAGGVGKTSLVATLGRALSSLGERVLLVEATSFGSLPYFFGTCDCRPGILRTFRPPAASSDTPIRLATIDAESLTVETAVRGSLAAEIQGWARGASRVIVDVATRSVATARGLSHMSPVVLVPLVPDVNSVLAADSIDAFFQRDAAAPGSPTDVYYVLNQFDDSLPLHQEVRKVLHDRLGDRLLPFTLQRTPAVSEALAEGMTIMDYAPDSPLADDFAGLAKWLGEVMAPVSTQSRGARWSER